MKKNWWSRSIRILPILAAALAVSNPAFADFWQQHWPHYPHNPHNPFFDAPEFDPALVIAGLAAAGTAAVLIWERVRRRR
jgi:hypothetical protein